MSNEYHIHDIRHLSLPFCYHSEDTDTDSSVENMPFVPYNMLTAIKLSLSLESRFKYATCKISIAEATRKYLAHRHQLQLLIWK